MAPPPPPSSVFKKHNAGTHLRPFLVHHIAVVEDKPFVHHKFAVAVSKGVSGGEEEEVPVLAHAKQTTDYEKLAPTWNLHKQIGSKPPLRNQRRYDVSCCSVLFTLVTATAVRWFLRRSNVTSETQVKECNNERTNIG